MAPDPGLIAAATGGSVACLLLLGAALASGGRDRQRLKRRVQRVRGGASRSATVEAAIALRLAPTASRTPGLDKFVKRWLPRQEILRQRLDRTGRNITLGRYGIWMALTALIVAGAALIGLRLGVLASAMLGLLAGVALPHMAVTRMARRRLVAFNGLFPDAIDLMVRALKSGLPITEAVITVGQELADPVGQEFRKVEGGLKVGRGLEDVLWEVANRLDTPEFRFFVISLSVQRQTGGNLGETLANLSDVLRRRRHMRLKIHALSSEARASALVLGVLPFIVMVLISVSAPGYLSPMFNDVRGLMLCAISLVSLSTGVLIMAKLIRFEI